MSIRIVTHCYANDKDQYAEFLKYQLSSLVLYPSKVSVSITVGYTDCDRKTCKVLNWFSDKLQIQHLQLPLASARKKPISRNMAVTGPEQAKEDVIFFTDCDYFFGFGCLDSIWQQWNQRPQGCAMIYPQWNYYTSRREGRHKYKWTEEIGIRDIDPAECNIRTNGRAIGGLMICDGNVAREIGWLRDSEVHQRPVDDEHWQRGRKHADDVKFRKSVYALQESRGVAAEDVISQVQIRNLFRIAHFI